MLTVRDTDCYLSIFFAFLRASRLVDCIADKDGVARTRYGSSVTLVAAAAVYKSEVHVDSSSGVQVVQPPLLWGIDMKRWMWTKFNSRGVFRKMRGALTRATFFY